MRYLVATASMCKTEKVVVCPEEKGLFSWHSKKCGVQYLILTDSLNSLCVVYWEEK